jgi:hypothetical protein
VQVKALRRANPLSKESYRLCIGLRNWKREQCPKSYTAIETERERWGRQCDVEWLTISLRANSLAFDTTPCYFQLNPRLESEVCHNQTTVIIHIKAKVNVPLPNFASRHEVVSPLVLNLDCGWSRNFGFNICLFYPRKISIRNKIKGKYSRLWSRITSWTRRGDEDTITHILVVRIR